MAYRNGILTSSNPHYVNVGGENVPFTATLNSSATGRLIRLSSNGKTGSHYPADYDGVTDSMVNVAVFSPLREIEFTGQAGDEWEIRPFSP